MLDEMQIAVRAIRPDFEAIDWGRREIYVNWLSQSYYIARRSTAFLGLCLLYGDEFPFFQERCAEHIGEETGHEKLALLDLTTMDVDLAPELPETMAFYQPQHFQITVINPAAFMGYVLFLELLAPQFGPYLIDHVQEKEALRFVRVHTTDDVDHIVKAGNVVDRLPQAVKTLIWANFRLSLHSYRQLLRSVAD